MRLNCKNAKIIDDEISENYGSKDMVCEVSFVIKYSFLNIY